MGYQLMPFALEELKRAIQQALERAATRIHPHTVPPSEISAATQITGSQELKA